MDDIADGLMKVGYTYWAYVTENSFIAERAGCKDAWLPMRVTDITIDCVGDDDDDDFGFGFPCEDDRIIISYVIDGVKGPYLYEDDYHDMTNEECEGDFMPRNPILGGKDRPTHTPSWVDE